MASEKKKYISGTFDKEGYMDYLKKRTALSSFYGRIEQYQKERQQRAEKQRQDAIRESMRHEVDDVRTEKQYRRWLDDKEKYDKAVAAETARDARGDDVRVEKQYSRYLDQKAQYDKAVAAMKKFDASGADVRQEKQYRRYLDALDQQKKLLEKQRKFDASGDDVRIEKQYKRYLDRKAQYDKAVAAMKKFDASGDDVRQEKQYKRYMERLAQQKKQLDKQRQFAVSGDDVRAEKQYKRYLDLKAEYDKAVAAQTKFDASGDDVRIEKQYKRYMENLAQRKKLMDRDRQFAVSGDDVRAEKQYKRYMEALDQQKKLLDKDREFAASGNDVRLEKQYKRYMEQRAMIAKLLDKDREFAASGNDVKAEKQYKQYMEQRAMMEKLLDKNREFAASGNDVQTEKKYKRYLNQQNKEKANTNNVFLGDMDYSGWMQPRSEGVTKALEIENAQKATQRWWAARERGELGQNGDIQSMNKKQRDAYRAELLPVKEQLEAFLEQSGQAGGVNYNGILNLYRDPEIEKYKEILQGDYTEEEKRNAEEQLYMLQNAERDEYGRSATERASEALWRLENEYDPEDKTEQTRDAQRRMVYDLMNGEGAYDNLTDEERTQINAEIDRASGNVLSGQTDITIIENKQSQLRTINNLLEQLDYQDELENRFNELMAGETEGDTQWHAENSVKWWEEDEKVNDAWDTMKVGSDVDDIYNLLEPGAYPKKWNITETGVGAALLMNDEMKNKFISLYNAGKKNEAWAFFEGVLPYLNQAYQYFEKTEQEQMASRNPIISSIGTVGANVLQTGEFLVNLPGQAKSLITGEQSGATDPYSSNYALARFKQNVRNKISKDLGKYGWIYSGAMSGIDSAVNMALSRGIGLKGKKALQAGTLALFGTQVFDTSLQNVMANGNGNFAYDVVEAFFDAAIETATEIWTVENLLSDPSNIVKYITKVAISEPSEEVVGAIVEPYIKEMIGHKHRYNERADQIFAQGGYTDKNGEFIKVKDFSDAKRQAMREWNHDIRMAAQEALISVGPMMVSGSATMAKNNQNVGRAIQQKTFENGQSGLNAMLESANALDAQTRSYQEAQKIMERLEQNKKVRPGKVGQLASDMVRESQEQAAKKAQSALRNEVRKELDGKNIRGSNVDEMSDLIVKAIQGGGIESLTRKEQNKIHDSAVGYNTLVKFQFASEQSSRAVAAQEQATKAERQAMQSVSDALGNTKTQTQPDDFVGKQLATRADIERTEGKQTGRANEVIVGRQFGRLEGMELVTEGEGENQHQEWKYKVVDGDGNTKYLKADELKATNYSTAAAIRLQLDNPAVYSGEYFNHLMKHINTQQNTKIGNYLRDAENVRWSAFFNEEMPQTELSDEEANEIYRLSQADLRSEWMKDQTSRAENFRGKGNGSATFGGTEFGSEEWNKRLDESGLTEDEKKTVNGLAGLAVSSGIRFNFVDQLNNNERIHGSEAQDGITIALRSFDSEQAKKEGRTHEIIVTVGHELTHWLRRNNAAGYIELQNYVVQTMKDRGVNIHARAQEILDNRRKGGDILTMSGAIEEMVANACDQVMASQEAADYLQENNPGLYEKIRSYVKDLVQRIKTMFAEKSTWASASRDSKFNMGLIGEQVNELNRIWWGKFDEVLSGQVKELQAEEQQQEKINLSMADENTRINLQGRANEHIKLNNEARDLIYAKYGINENDIMFGIEFTDDGKVDYAAHDDAETKLIRKISKADLRELYKLSVDTEKWRATWDENAQLDTADYYENADKLGTETDLNHLFGKSIAPVEKWAPYVKRYGQYVALNKEAYRDLDAEYADAVERKDWQTAEKMLMDKYQKMEKDGLVGYNAPHFFNGDHAEIAKKIKSGDQKTIQAVAKEMAQQVPENALLIPMPPHTGKVTSDTDTMILAKAIAEITGSPVETALESNEHMSRNAAKKQGIRGVTAESMGFRKAQEVTYGRYIGGEWVQTNGMNYIMPDEVMPVFIDNVVGGAVTAQAAKNAIGRGITLAYAQSSRAKVQGAKVLSVTYDNSGKLIPLSERMDASNPSWKFSMAEPVEETKDLIAVHNLTQQNLLDTLAEGAFTAPSIAVIRAQQGHTKYGDISVLFWKDTIDPKKSVRNKVYGTDAWTPTRNNAQIEYKLNYDVMHKAERYVHDELMKDVDDYYRREASRWINQRAYDNETTKTIDDWALDAYGNYGMLAAYQTARGNTIEQKYMDVADHSDIRNDQLNIYNGFLETLDERGLLDEFMDDFENSTGNEVINKWGPVFGESGETANQIYTAYQEYNKDGLIKRVLLAKMREAKLYQEDGREIKTHKEIDRDAMMKAMQEKTDKADFNSWMKDMLGDAFGEKGIYNGVDPYTAIGDRRSFNQTHWPVTVENIVKAMYRNHEAKGGEAGGASGLMAKASKEYRSIPEIRRDKGRLQTLDNEEYKAKVENLDTELDNFVDELAETNEYASYMIREFMIDAAGEYARTNRAESFRRAMAKEGINLTDNQLQRAVELMEEAREIPTGYFEAKPERVVGFNEIAKVVIPQNASAELIKKLEYNGIIYETYDGTDEDRLAKINDESIMFSMAEDDAADVGLWMMGLTESSVHTEGERALIREYRGLRTSLELSRKRQAEYREQIEKLQAKATLNAEERDMLIILQNKLQVQQDKQARLEQELYDVTRSEGYAGMMYRNSRIFDEYVNGKNQQQVQAAVDTLINEAEQAQKNIEKRQKEIRKMADDAAVSTIRRELKNRGLSWATKELKKNYFTAMSSNEIEGRLAEIVLKAVNGEEITAEVESLANDMITNGIGFGSEIAEEALSNVRGMTIEIGPGQQAEMKANHLTLKDIRTRTKGSGVTFKYGTRSTLDINAEEIGELIPDLRENLKNERSSLEDFVAWIERQLAAKKGNAQDYGINPEEVAIVITTCANAMLDADQGGMSAEMLRKRIAAAQGEIGKLADAVNGLMESAKEIQSNAMKASNAAGGLRADAVAAIDYYNLIARQAAEVERNRVKRTVIDELRSENTRKLIEQQQKYEEMMKKERKARQLKQDNDNLRNVINTDIKRLKKLLVEETDQKNIQEEAKPLARMLCSMLVNHDMAGWRRVLLADKQQLVDFQMRLAKMDAANGSFDMDTDLEWLVIHAPNAEDNDTSIRDAVMKDLENIETGLLEYRNAEGQGVVSLADRKAALEKVQEAVSEIYDVIKARTQAFIQGQKWQVYELAEMLERDMENSRFKGERRGRGSRVLNWFWNDVGYGNMTPEYFFKNLRNRTMSMLQQGLHEAEQRSGLEAREAQKRIAQIAADTGYANWDGQEKHKVTLSNGRSIEMTTEQLMALYATWNREKNMLRPEDTAHLLKGGFVLADSQANEGKTRREKTNQRPIRVTEEDLNSIGSYLTDQQRAYADAIVGYMSNDLAQLGNEASLRAYGIRKFTEQYYFPIKSWGGVLNQSSTSGVNSQNENRAMRQSFTRRLTANARNALEIGDFTPTAMKHITGMITFNTVGPAVENINKVLNQQLDYNDSEEMDPDESYKRNMRAAFQESYGKAAYDYLTTFMKDVNGGVARRNETILRERLLSLFKKNAVAGSMSVAAQQPLSYIRASMAINPKYLAQAISQQYWKGSYEEMMSHSGLAVIKDMGKFDMNFGRSMQDYITPDGMESKARKAWKAVNEGMTSLPGKMDAMTWTRMWTACKLEQASLHPEMDVKSEEFLDTVAERFNELMRKTQVYDSVMVKSQNMRSDNYLNKIRTSFMAEPTLSLNVLADAWINIKEKGGKANAAKALATFLLSAAAQAGVKAFFGTGRSPDKKKTQEENFWNKFMQSFLSEANMLGLIPGYSQITEAFINGELNDDAMGMIGKAKDAVEKMVSLITSGAGDRGTYRALEDSIAQMVQLGTDVPLKNIMRDFRAMVNWFGGPEAEKLTGSSYATRPTSSAVLKVQSVENLATKELGGLINAILGDAGYKTTSDAYVQRIYDAQKAGNEDWAKDLREYYVLAKSKAQDPEKSLNQQMNALTKKDEDLSAEDKIEALEEAGYGSMGAYVLEQFRAGEIDRKTAEEQYRKANPNANEKKVAETLDGAEWTRDNKELPEGQNSYTNYTPLIIAIGNNRSGDIREAVQKLVKIGYTAKDIKTQITKQFKQSYVAASQNERIRLRNAIQMVYKEIGLKAEDADKVINKWK